MLCLAFLALRLYYGDQMDSRYYALDSFLEDTAETTLTGTLDHIDIKTNSSYLFLKNVSVQIGTGSQMKQFYFSDFLLINQSKQSDFPSSGNLLRASGKIYPFLSPSNPGQFDEKAYYKEKNIFYKMTVEHLSIVRNQTSQVKQFLYNLRDRLVGVYQECMPEKEAGIVSAMLLGDKTLLDADIKTLYQVNGIGHILAISGLHISIICTLLYRLFLFLKLPRPAPFLAALVFLIGYGEMTGFGISTSRAVIMMLMWLFAAEIGRSYDALTALAVSAVWIFLQKPYAIFSCSFLLSYSAVLGVYLTYPALKGIFFGNIHKQEAMQRRNRRKRREIMANSRLCCAMPSSLMEKYLLPLPEKVLSSLLLSFSIQITTLPVVLYFFYEVPTYGILLNLFVLPLVSVLVALSMLGGILGVFVLLPAKPVLCAVTVILDFYEQLCRFFLLLPEPVQILGHPSLIQVLLYYLLLAFILFVGHRRLYRMERRDESGSGMLGFSVLFGFFFAVVILLYRKPVSGIEFTMLDVGQGDGLLLRSETGITIMIDGGSSDSSQVGTYRILPYLKYYGIRHIDYMVMTHADQDHISGQMELMQKCKMGVSIGCYLLPELAQESMDENYHEIRETALKAGIPVRYFNTGDSIISGGLKLLCLHPDRNFSNETANACSTTLSLTYGGFRMLLTGDLEKEGEEIVAQRLKENAVEKYTVLKVAHHGSKNSTSEAFLSLVNPKISIISCGRNNRYGHPHKDLLQRLEKSGARIYQTAQSGEITITTDGKMFRIQAFLPEAGE